MSGEPLVLKVQRLRPDARVPLKAHDSDAAFDIFCVEPILAEMSGCYRIPTGIAIELPEGWFAQIRGRSSLASRGITPTGGCIDPGFRGEWIVNLLVPPCGLPFIISPGDRVAQFTLHEVPRVVLEEANGLSPSERGSGGFGSTGR